MENHFCNNYSFSYYNNKTIGSILYYSTAYCGVVVVKDKAYYFGITYQSSTIFANCVLFMVFFNQNSVGVSPPPSCSNFIY